MQKQQKQFRIKNKHTVKSAGSSTEGHLFKLDVREGTGRTGSIAPLTIEGSNENFQPPLTSFQGHSTRLLSQIEQCITRWGRLY